MKATLQINAAGSWRNVIQFDWPEHRPDAQLAGDALVRATDAAIGARIVAGVDVLCIRQGREWKDDPYDKQRKRACSP